MFVLGIYYYSTTKTAFLATYGCTLQLICFLTLTFILNPLV